MSSPTVRRSRRQRRPNPKYSTDALDREVVRLLRESSESSHQSSTTSYDSDETGPDNNLDILIGTAQANVTSSLGYDENNISVASETTREVSGEVENLPPATSETHKLIVDTPVWDTINVIPESELGTREQFSMLFGHTDEEILPILHVRDRWLGAEDATFPSRKTLAKSIAEGIYGRTVAGGVAPEKLREEATQNWEWYYDEARGARFREQQRVEEVVKEIAQDGYLPELSGQGHEVVMGPWNGQEIFHVGDMCALDFGEAWEVQKRVAQQSISPEADLNAIDLDASPGGAGSGATAIPSATTSTPKERYHEGFLLYLGQKVQCLSWAPCLTNSLFQYLAVSCSSISSQCCSNVPSRSDPASKPRPSPPTRSSIQIWAFRSASHATHAPARLDTTTRPRLVQVLCTDWGDIRQIRWSPVSKDIHAATNHNEPSSGEERLGPLGVITSDGFARVLDISIHLPTPDQGTQYLHVSSPAFTISPPTRAVFTALAFASTSDLIVAASTGVVGVYNITNYANSDADQPHLTCQLDEANIFAISNAYPPAHPSVVASTSASGTLSLTDVRCPPENVSTSNTSGYPLHLAYSPLTRSFITASGCNGNPNSLSMLSCHTVRHFANGKDIGRVPGEGPATALASSRWHPSILVGTADGSVFCTNYLRALIPQAEVTESASAYIQKLCEYEWIPTEPGTKFSKTSSAVRPVEQLTGGLSDGNADTALPTRQELGGSRTTEDQHIEVTMLSTHDARPGRSRFHEGFRAEILDVTAPTPGITGEGFGNDSVFQEEQGVTAIDWNPNLSCAGWLAVAWGSGLLRVQDVAHGV